MSKFIVRMLVSNFVQLFDGSSFFEEICFFAGNDFLEFLVRSGGLVVDFVFSAMKISFSASKEKAGTVVIKVRVEILLVVLVD